MIDQALNKEDIDPNLKNLCYRSRETSSNFMNAMCCTGRSVNMLQGNLMLSGMSANLFLSKEYPS